MAVGRSAEDSKKRGSLALAGRQGRRERSRLLCTAAAAAICAAAAAAYVLFYRESALRVALGTSERTSKRHKDYAVGLHKERKSWPTQKETPRRIDAWTSHVVQHEIPCFQRNPALINIRVWNEAVGQQRRFICPNCVISIMLHLSISLSRLH